MTVKTKWLGVVVALLLVIVAAAGCAGKGQTKTGEGEQPGSLSGSIKIAGSTSVQPLSEELADAFMNKNPNVSVMVAGGGSSAGIKAAQDGAAHIGASSRELKPEEKTGLTETVIAKDGIAIIVNPKNGVSELTLDQIKKIFAGEITNWKDVGGKDAPINVFTREEGSGTRGAFEEIVMGKDKKITGKAGVQNATGAVRTAVERDENAIGYISLGSLNEKVKAVTVDGVKPSEETVLNGTYKISRPFIYLTKGAPTGVVKAYIDFVLSPEGQKIVGEKYVPVRK
ncbi:MAG TPA: phosphate ABC transporter substrate-binding protein [Syntrophomonadaceae bacterium]|nr:phosphate ABC transporter substrate-binding protein [Syntrophomonadaceae bacterium]